MTAPPVFSPDGRLLAVSDGPIAFSPDGKRLATGGGVAAQIWDVTSGQKIRSIGAQGESSEHVRLTLWDLANGRQLWTVALLNAGDFINYYCQTRSVTFSPDGRTLATGSIGGGLLLWDAALGRRLRLFNGPPVPERHLHLAHPGQVTIVQFIAGGDILISVGGDGSLREWDPATGTLRRTIITPGIQALTLMPGRKAMLMASRQDVVVRSFPGGRVVKVLRGHDEDVVSAVPTLDGRTAWSGALDGTIKRWDLARGRDVATYGTIQQAAVSPDDHSVAYSLGDSNITLKDTRSGRLLKTLRGFYRPEREESFSNVSKTLKFASNSRRLAGGAYTTAGFVDHSGVFHSRVLLWDIPSGRITHEWAEDPAGQLFFSPDSRRLVELSPELSDTPDLIQVRSVPGGRLLRRWKFAGAPDGTFGVTGDKLQPSLNGATIRFRSGGRILIGATGYFASGRPFGIAGHWDVMTGKQVDKNEL